jgi:hypothetical protein
MACGVDEVKRVNASEGFGRDILKYNTLELS